MTWPVQNIATILMMAPVAAQQASTKESTKKQPAKTAGDTQPPKGAATENKKGEKKEEYAWYQELFVRHLRLSTYLLIAYLSYQHDLSSNILARAAVYKPDWMLEVLARNVLIMLCTYGVWHLFLYGPLSGPARARIEHKKFHPEEQYEEPGNLKREIQHTFLGFCMSTVYECAMYHMWAIGRVPYFANFWDYPIFSIINVLIVAYWRDLHFYFAHRMMHPWNIKIKLYPGHKGIDPGRRLYQGAHKLHHLSVSPGPFSGLSMHPIEHLFYYSCVLFPACFVAVHPFHFLYNKVHADISPCAGHDGFGEPAGGSYFHYLHHAHYECNFGTPMVPMDKWFGTYEDGLKYRNKSK